MRTRFAFGLLLLAFVAAAPLAAQGPGGAAAPAGPDVLREAWPDGWRWGGAVGVGIGQLATGSANCNDAALAVAGGEVRLRRGRWVLAGLIEGVASGGDCTTAVVLFPRNDSLFADVSGVDPGSPRLGVRAGGLLPIEASMLATVGAGLLRIDPHARAFDARLAPWLSVAAELGLGFLDLGLRVEHGRYRGQEALALQRTSDGEDVGEVPLFTREPWEAFTVLALLKRF